MNLSKSNRQESDVVIVSAVRTPLCRARRGGLAQYPPATLLSVALKGCLQKCPGVSPSDVEDVCVGNVLSPASGAAALRMGQLSAGFPSSVALRVVNRQCSSGLQAVADIANAIAAGDIKIGIGAGCESMSTHPMNKMPMPEVDWDVVNACSDAKDCIIPMGVTSENVSKLKFSLSRTALDSFAARSHKKASQARAEGKFKAEIVPVDGVMEDDGIRPQTTVESLSRLKPVFDKEGSTTAGNSSQLTDGAAAILLTTRGEARSRGLSILGTWRSYAVVGVPPRIMGIGPAVAIPAALTKAGLSLNEVDVFEINEAFASQATWCMNHLDIDEDKVNPNGGAIALGHPLGCTGARQVATLLHEMQRRGSKARFGCISMCIGTGMGAAAVLEVEPKASAL